MNLSDYIKAQFPSDETSQFHIECDKIGDWIIEEISYLYTTKTIRTSPSFPTMLDEITDPNSPAKDNQLLAYYVFSGFGSGFDVVMASALIYLTTPAPTLPPPPPYLYPGGVINSYMLDEITTGLALQGNVPNANITLLIQAFDNFLVDKFATTT